MKSFRELSIRKSELFNPVIDLLPKQTPITGMPKQSGDICLRGCEGDFILRGRVPSNLDILGFYFPQFTLDY
jgi:hypothetical protein